MLSDTPVSDDSEAVASSDVLDEVFVPVPHAVKTSIAAAVKRAKKRCFFVLKEFTWFTSDTPVYTKEKA